MNYIHEIRTFEANSPLFRNWMQVTGRRIEKITKNVFSAKAAFKEWSRWNGELLQTESRQIFSVLNTLELNSLDQDLLARVRIGLEIPVSKFTGQQATDLGEFIIWARKQPGLIHRVAAKKSSM